MNLRPCKLYEESLLSCGQFDVRNCSVKGIGVLWFLLDGDSQPFCSCWTRFSYTLVDNPRAMLRDFKTPFDHVTHISCSIVNINIYKYRANLVDLKILRNICK
jgi:hypothetical protein